MKEQRRQSGIGRAIGAFALGAATGSVVALLFAPVSGQVARKRLAMKLRTLKTATSRKLDDLREAATEKVSDARQWVLSRISTPNGHRKPAMTRRRVAHHHA